MDFRAQGLGFRDRYPRTDLSAELLHLVVATTERAWPPTTGFFYEDIYIYMYVLRTGIRVKGFGFRGINPLSGESNGQQYGNYRISLAPC